MENTKELILESQLEELRMKTNNLSILDLFAQVAEFQEATDQPVNTVPQLLNPEYGNLRYNLMYEENQEYLDAILENDLVEVLDSLVDQFYILAGSVNSHGLQDVFLEAFSRVHGNNMTKVVDGKVLRNSVGKIIKPEGFKPVNLEDLV